MKPQFKLVIAGSRDFSDFDLLKDRCDLFLKNKLESHEITIVCGGARGADSLGNKYALLRGFKVEMFLPDWNGLGRSAGHVRNVQMLNNSDAVVVFWDGKSMGSYHMITITQNANKPLRVVRF